jgi:hypothetical protein
LGFSGGFTSFCFAMGFSSIFHDLYEYFVDILLEGNNPWVSFTDYLVHSVFSMPMFIKTMEYGHNNQTPVASCGVHKSIFTMNKTPILYLFFILF